MVFQARKRHGRKQSEKGVAKTIKDLPDELLLAVLEHMPGMSDVLKLRETCRALVPACSSTVRERLKVLYIHPTSSSIRRAINMSQSDLGSHIEEICLVNQVFWHHIRQNPTGCFEYTWPASTSKRGAKIPIPTGPDDEYTKILAPLASLPQVHALSFRDACEEPGFNMKSTQYNDNQERVVRHSKQRAPSKELRAESKLYATETITQRQPQFRYKDADVLTPLFNLSVDKLANLKLTEELPWLDINLLHTNVAWKLRQVELHVNPGWHNSDWQQFCNVVVRQAALTLEELKLAFQHNPAFMRKQQADTSLNFIIQDLEFPVLQRLELCALQPKVYNTNTRTLLMQHFDLKTFISERCNNLRKLLLDHVLPLPQLRDAQWETLDEMMLDMRREVRTVGEPRDNLRDLEIDP